MSDEKLQKIGEDSLRGVREKIDKWLKQDDRIMVSMASPVVEEDHNEGDEWLDSDGKKWTIKNGIKQSISKTEGARMPWWCPKCSKGLNHKNDEKMWYLYGVCFDCVTKYETQLQIEGKFETYEKKKVLANQISATKYFIEQTVDGLRYLVEQPNLEYVFSDGSIEQWVVPNAEQMKEDMINDLEKANEHLTKLQAMYDEVLIEYNELGIREIQEKS